MSGLINFIKSLFSGIFGFLGSLVGSKKGSDSAAVAPAKSKKSNGFYLELDDASSNGSSAAPSQSAAPTSAPATAEKTEKKSSKRAEQLAAAAKAENGDAKPAAVKAPEPATVAKALNLPEPTVTNFATDYLLTNGNNGRRRPGANMSSYLDMARQVKAPSRG